MTELLSGKIWYTVLSSGTARTGRINTNKDHNAIADSVSSDEDLELSISDSITINSKTYIITEIGTRSFNKFTRLKILSISSKITKIGDRAFDVCRLNSYPDINNVRDIGYLAFASNNFIAANLPNTIEKVGDAAFVYCTKLKEITIPESSSYICKDEQGIIYDIMKTRIIWVSRFLENVTLPLTIQSIPDHLFAYSLIKEITIPPLCNSIGHRSFMYCNNLSKITITGNIKSIDTEVVSDCSNIKVIEYHGLTKIGSVDIKSDVIVRTCNQYKYSQCFGREHERSGECPLYNILRIKTCHNNKRSHHSSLSSFTLIIMLSS